MSLILSKLPLFIVLPNPDWQDSYSAISAMNIHQSMDQATVYSYIKRSSLSYGSNLLHRTWIISNIDYALLDNLQTFLLTFAGQSINVDCQSCFGRINGYILNNPVELVTEKRGHLSDDCIDSSDGYITDYDKEGMTITLEFEGT